MSSDAACPGHEEVSTEAAWALLLAGARLRREGRPRRGLAADAGGAVREVDSEDPDSALAWQAGQGWSVRGVWSAAARDLLALYRPLLEPAAGRSFALGHLGQSLDGFIATAAGDSCFVNGDENLVHLHRLRALCDAVVVGAGTVAADNPRLTTRRVPGGNPVRVVLDAAARLPADRHVFADEAAPTLLLRGAGRGHARAGSADVVEIEADGDGRLDPFAVRRLLAARGLHVVLVEGGGVTVSRFLAAGALDRLHVAVAPFFIGAGLPGVSVAPALRLADCPRPPATVLRMGTDVLFDLDLAAHAAGDDRRSQASPGSAPSTTTAP